MDNHIPADNLDLNTPIDIAMLVAAEPGLWFQPFPPSALAYLTHRWIECPTCGQVNASWRQACAECESPLSLPDFSDVSKPA